MSRVPAKSLTRQRVYRVVSVGVGVALAAGRLRASSILRFQRAPHRPILTSGFPETDRCHNEFIDAMFGAIGRGPG
jgi:hypothetical protein